MEEVRAGLLHAAFLGSAAVVRPDPTREGRRPRYSGTQRTKEQAMPDRTMNAVHKCGEELHRGEKTPPAAEWIVRAARPSAEPRRASWYRPIDRTGDTYACCADHLVNAIASVGGESFIVRKVR